MIRSALPKSLHNLQYRRTLVTKPRRRPPPPVARRRAPAASKPQVTTATDLPYGLRRVDYRQPPPKWPLPPHPPPRQNPVRRYFPQAVLLLAASVAAYIYFHQDEEVYEYWRQVEQGNVPIDGDEEDDDWDDDDDDDDDEEAED